MEYIVSKYKFDVRVSNTNLFTFSLFLSFIVMATNYFYTIKNGLVLGGEFTRLYLKFLCFFIWVILSKNVKFRHLLILMPVIYIAVFPVIFFGKIQGAYLQAINFSFCLPIFFIDFSKIRFEEVLKNLLIFITIFHVILYLLFRDIKVLENGGFVGSVGNPNSLGVIASITIFFSYLINSPVIRYLVVGANVVFAGLSGSLLALLLPVMSLFLILPLAVVGIISCFILVLTNYFNDVLALIRKSDEVPLAVLHALSKLEGLFLLISNIEVRDLPFSFKNRILYYQEAFDKLTTTPSLIFGHNDFSETYFTGDGALIGYAATHGVIIFILFLLTNVYVMYLGFCLKSKFATRVSFIIFIFMISLITNRTFDYWPMGIFYSIFLCVLLHKKFNDEQINRVS